MGDSCCGKMILQSTIKRFGRTITFCSGSTSVPDAGGYNVLSLYLDGLEGILKIWVDFKEIFHSTFIAAAMKLLNEVLNYHIDAPFSAYTHCNDTWIDGSCEVEWIRMALDDWSYLDFYFCWWGACRAILSGATNLFSRATMAKMQPREAGTAEHPCRATRPGATSTKRRATTCGATGSPTSAARWRNAGLVRQRGSPVAPSGMAWQRLHVALLQMARPNWAIPHK